MGYEKVSKKGYVPKFKMKQLTKQSDKNSPSEYDRIFYERAKKGPNWQDVRRWKTLLKYFGGGIITDIGCLDSKIYEFVKGDFKYMGTDVASEAIQEMSKRYPYSNCTFLVDNIYETKIVNEVADYVILGEVLEHMDDPKRVVKEAWRILKPNGVLAISVPLEEAIEPGACDKDRHIWSYTENDLIDLIPGHAEVKTKVLRSKWFPKYKYCFPQLILWAKKI